MIPSLTRPPCCSQLLLLSLLGISRCTTTHAAAAAKSIDHGTFQDPSANVRARFRYWVNDASVSLARVADDIRSVARAGGGGIELLPYYLYGGTGSWGGGNDAPLQSDWTVYGFGMEAWSE